MAMIKNLPSGGELCGVAQEIRRGFALLQFFDVVMPTSAVPPGARCPSCVYRQCSYSACEPAPATARVHLLGPSSVLHVELIQRTRSLSSAFGLIDENRARQRLIGALEDALLGRPRPAAFSTIGTAFRLAGTSRHSRRSRSSDGIDVARHPLDQHVVVFGSGVVTTRGRAADDGFGGIIESSGIGTGAEQLDRRIGPGRVDLIPAGDLALLQPAPRSLSIPRP